MSEDEAYHRAVQRASGVQESSGVILSDIASISKEYMLKVSLVTVYSDS